MVEGGMKCVKILLFSFNFIFVIAAIGLIAAGAYVQIQLKDYFDLIEGSFSSAAALLIAVGVIIFFIALFGCCGAWKENHTCVMIFAVLLSIIFILEIAGGITGFVLKAKVKDTVEEFMTKSLKNDKPVWNDVQKDFKCCGIHNYTDWDTIANKSISQYCCKERMSDPKCIDDLNNVYHVGCYDKFVDFVESKIYIIGGVGIGLAFVQIVGILFACCLARAIKKEYEVV